MKRIVLVLLVSFCLMVGIGEVYAGVLVDAAKKVETKWGEIEKDNKDVKRASDWVNEKVEQGKKWVNDRTK